nr:NADH dehydrogenase subunit 6 [Angerianus maurus]
MSMIMSMMMSINMLMLFMKHPLSMGLLLIIQTTMISMMTGMLLNTFMMSYILMISMLSGMLVLFVYMSSISSNEKFKYKMSIKMMFIMTLMMTGVFLFPQEKMIIKNNYGMEIPLFLNKLFTLENKNLTIMLVLYLFFSMIVSSYLVNIFKGPMRMKN